MFDLYVTKYSSTQKLANTLLRKSLHIIVSPVHASGLPMYLTLATFISIIN